MLTPGTCKAAIRSASFGDSAACPLTRIAGGRALTMRWIRSSVLVEVCAPRLPGIVTKSGRAHIERKMDFVIRNPLPPQAGFSVEADLAVTVSRQGCSLVFSIVALDAAAAV